MTEQVPDAEREQTPSQTGRVQFGADPGWPGRPVGTTSLGPVDVVPRAVADAGWTGTDPLSEETLAELRELASRYPQARSALLPMLHLVQSTEGYVTSAGIEACADILGQTTAEVSAVATFYSMYKRRPAGDYLVGVCTNTLCAVMGGDAIFERLKGHLDIGNDETTPDGMVSLEHIECNAACDYAPVVMVNWEFFDNQTPQSATDLVDALRAGEPVTSTRGARLCTWREAERVLAGFPDDRADEGPVGGPATLVGLQIAREHGWSAPGVGEQDGERHPRTSAEQDDPLAAVQQADTSRAETETVADKDTSTADAVPEGDAGGDARERDDRRRNRPGHDGRGRDGNGSNGKGEEAR